MTDLPAPYLDHDRRAAIARIATSHVALTGRPLVGPCAEPVTAPVRALWEAPLAIVAHGTETDPLFFFASRMALARFGMDAAQFIGMPSRFSAEAPLRDERQALLERVSRDGFIDDYAGVRIAADGRRFRIEAATVWNLVDPDGTVHGQAAAFSRWTEL
ncbi:MEKHLA domain-containing protein [Novosphingobium bradum]|uniref:MEKHLA domain-containing protein n=1 Tax=Novosphingobium bradum TaxID=1737444 RepID=A0ABV7IX90_9SPHN